MALGFWMRAKAIATAAAKPERVITEEQARQLTPETLRQLAAALDRQVNSEIGDGRAQFLSDMTDEEYAVWLIEQDSGWKAFRDRVFSLGAKPATSAEEDSAVIQ